MKRAIVLTALFALTGCQAWFGEVCGPSLPCDDGRFCAEDGFCTSGDGSRLPDMDEVSVGQGYACGRVAETEELICWGEGGGPGTIGPIAVNGFPVLQFSAGDGFVCLLTEEGPRCVGRTLSLPDLSVGRLVSSRGGVCALLDGEGQLFCDGANDFAPPGGSGFDLFDASLNNSGPEPHRVCGLASDRGLQCSDGALINRLPDLVDSQIDDLALTRDALCVSVRRLGDQALSCTDGTQNRLVGNLVDGSPVRAGDDFVCGLTEVGLRCTDLGLNDELAAANARPEPEQFDAGGDAVCWIDGGAVRCVSRNNDDPVLDQSTGLVN